MSVTLVDLTSGRPVAIAKRKPKRRGMIFDVDGIRYKVHDIDRDLVYVYPQGMKPNPPTTMAGYNPEEEKPEVPEKEPKKKVEGPVYPRDPFGTEGGYLVPQERERPYAPFYERGYPTAEWPVERPMPMSFTVVHFSTETPIYRTALTRIPNLPYVDLYGGETYEWRRVVGRSIYARPIPSWNYAVIALVKDKGRVRYFLPISNKKQMSRAKYMMNRIMKQDGYKRKQYSLMTIPWERMKRYHHNPEDGEVAPRMVPRQRLLAKGKAQELPLKMAPKEKAAGKAKPAQKKA